MLNDLPPLPPIHRKSSAKAYAIDTPETETFTVPGQLQEDIDRSEIRPKTTERRTNLGLISRNHCLDDDSLRSRDQATTNSKKCLLCCCSRNTGSVSDDEDDDEVGQDNAFEQHHVNMIEEESDSMSSSVAVAHQFKS